MLAMTKHTEILTATKNVKEIQEADSRCSYAREAKLKRSISKYKKEFISAFQSNIAMHFERIFMPFYFASN